MITCKKFLDELGAYLDEQTSPELRQELENHLSECPNCWVVTDTTKKTIKVYKGMDRYPISGELHNKLISAITRACDRRSGSNSEATDTNTTDFQKA